MAPNLIRGRKHDFISTLLSLLAGIRQGLKRSENGQFQLILFRLFSSGCPNLVSKLIAVVTAVLLMPIFLIKGFFHFPSFTSHFPKVTFERGKTGLDTGKLE